MGRRIPRYVATARSGDFQHHGLYAQCHVVCWGIRSTRPLHLGPPAAWSAHALCGPRISSRHQANHRDAVSPRLPIEPSTNPKRPQPLLSTTGHGPMPRSAPRPEVGRLGGLSALLLAATSPDFVPSCLVLPDWMDVDKSCRRAPRRFKPIIFGLKRPRSLWFRTRSVNPFLPAPPRPDPHLSLPRYGRLARVSLTDCHNFFRYTLYPVGIWLFPRHGRRAAFWNPAPGFHVEHGQPDTGGSS